MPWASRRPTTKIISEESNLARASGACSRPARPRQTTQTSGNAQIKQDQSDARRPERRNHGRKFIIIAVVILLAIGAAIFYWHSTFTEDTDDAQVDGDLYQVSSRVTGQVIKVYVDDNQK